MDNYGIYQNIATRTNGDIYIGVVGPVRTGKSTFIKNFMNTAVLPNIKNEYKKERARDELPQSSNGKMIMTTEPKFVPNEAVEVVLDDVKFNMRMIDCVGYLVKNALGHVEGNVPRMVNTPWFEKQIPFEEAAEIGTKKVIQDDEFFVLPEDYINWVVCRNTAPFPTLPHLPENLISNHSENVM